MAYKLRKIGNSIGVILPKALVERAGLARGSAVDIEETDGAIVIRQAAETQSMSPAVAKWYRGFKSRYHEALQNLAR